MTAMNGMVEAISTKDVSTKFGVKPTFSFKVGGNWIKSGFKNPGVAVGDNVEFDGVTGTYGVETKAVTILKQHIFSREVAVVPSPTSTSAPVVATTKATYSSYKEKVFPIPPLHGDRAIVRQNALARASDLYIAARGGKPFELEISTLDLVISFARKFEAYTAGDLDMAEAMKEDEQEGTPAP